MFRSKRDAAMWLSGIIDGEGNVSQRPVKGTRGFVREVRITNTDPLILGAVKEALAVLGVTCAIYDRSARARLGSKPISDIVIGGKANLLRLAQDISLQSEKQAKLDTMLGSYIRPGVPPEDQLRAMAAAESDVQIASRFGVTAPAVWGWRKKYGIERVKTVAAPPS